MQIFINFFTHFKSSYPLQVANCDSNSRLVVDEVAIVNSGLKGLICQVPNRPRSFINLDCIHPWTAKRDYRRLLFFFLDNQNTVIVNEMAV